MVFLPLDAQTHVDGTSMVPVGKDLISLYLLLISIQEPRHVAASSRGKPKPTKSPTIIPSAFPFITDYIIVHHEKVCMERRPVSGSPMFRKCKEP
jgi:hypothetical protein